MLWLTTIQEITHTYIKTHDCTQFDITWVIQLLAMSLVPPPPLLLPLFPSPHFLKVLCLVGVVTGFSAPDSEATQCEMLWHVLILKIPGNKINLINLCLKTERMLYTIIHNQFRFCLTKDVGFIPVDDTTCSHNTTALVWISQTQLNVLVNSWKNWKAHLGPEMLLRVLYPLYWPVIELVPIFYDGMSQD